MSNELKKIEEKVDSLPIDSVESAVKQEIKPLSGLNRQLTEDDLKSPGVRKLLLGQLDEYETCKTTLDKVTQQFHEKDKQTAVLIEKLEAFSSFDWLYSALLTVGSILIGYYASQPDKGTILLFTGVGCIIIALFFKYRHSNENKNV